MWFGERCSKYYNWCPHVTTQTVQLCCQKQNTTKKGCYLQMDTSQSNITHRVYKHFWRVNMYYSPLLYFLLSYNLSGSNVKNVHLYSMYVHSFSLQVSQIQTKTLWFLPPPTIARHITHSHTDTFWCIKQLYVGRNNLNKSLFTKKNLRSIYMSLHAHLLWPLHRDIGTLISPLQIYHIPRVVINHSFSGSFYNY